MTLPELHVEIWTHIARHVRVQFPNQPRDVTKREQIRQVDLVNLMTVSKVSIVVISFFFR